MKRRGRIGVFLWLVWLIGVSSMLSEATILTMVDQWPDGAEKLTRKANPSTVELPGYPAYLREGESPLMDSFSEYSIPLQYANFTVVSEPDSWELYGVGLGIGGAGGYLYKRGRKRRKK